MAFAFGNFITQADIDGKGWRWVFWIASMPGFVLGILMLFTLKEPARSERGDGKVSCVFTFYFNILIVHVHSAINTIYRLYALHSTSKIVLR